MESTARAEAALLEKVNVRTTLEVAVNQLRWIALASPLLVAEVVRGMRRLADVEDIHVRYTAVMQQLHVPKELAKSVYIKRAVFDIMLQYRRVKNRTGSES